MEVVGKAAPISTPSCLRIRSQVNIKKLSYTLFFLLLLGCILTNPETSVSYALNGLYLWFDRMIPSLLPFMILSGIMVRMGLTEQIASLIYPVIAPFWRVSKNVVYGMLMGFLCGFPMGAKTARDLLDKGAVTRREATFLLAFCNNIGPVYFVSYVLPILGLHPAWPYLLGMYGLPLAYSLLLRHTRFRNLSEAASCRTDRTKAAVSATEISVWTQIDEAIASSLHSILMLGGYMILFNLLNILPKLLGLSNLLCPLLEITGGIGLLGSKVPLYILILLPFGGLSCLAQTASILRGSGLSLAAYVKHKLLLTAMSAAYYVLIINM